MTVKGHSGIVFAFLSSQKAWCRQNRCFYYPQCFLRTVLFLKPLPLPLPALLYKNPGLFQGYFPTPSNAEVSAGVPVAKTVWGQSTKPKDLPQPWPDGHVMMTNSTFKASLLGGQTELHPETGRKPGQRGDGVETPKNRVPTPRWYKQLLPLQDWDFIYNTHIIKSYNSAAKEQNLHL